MQVGVVGGHPWNGRIGRARERGGVLLANVSALRVSKVELCVFCVAASGD